MILEYGTDNLVLISQFFQTKIVNFIIVYENYQTHLRDMNNFKSQFLKEKISYLP